MSVDIHFRSLIELSSKLMNCYKDASKLGQSDSAVIALSLSLRFKIFDGCNLVLLSNSFEDWLKLTVSQWALHLFLMIQYNLMHYFYYPGKAEWSIRSTLYDTRRIFIDGTHRKKC